MPDDTVEVVRRIHEAWLADESAAPWLTDDIEYVNPPDAVETGTKHGLNMFDRVSDVYEEFHVEIERLIALGDRAVVLVRGRARARGSGVEFDFRQGYIWTVKDGKAVRFEWFNEPRQALAAAGLDPAQGEGDATRSG